MRRRLRIFAPTCVFGVPALLPGASADHGNANNASPNMIRVDGDPRGG
jgi:hypothetical protein